MSKEAPEPEKWVENYADMLYRYTLVRVKDPDVADELVQATLFAALKSQRTFVGKSTEKTWLFGILKHKTMDQFRSAKKYINLDITDADADLIQFDTTGHMTSSPNNWNVGSRKSQRKQRTRPGAHKIYEWVIREVSSPICFKRNRRVEFRGNM